MRISIRLKFIILIFLLLTIVTLLIFYFTLDRVREALSHEIKLQGELIGRMIALNAEDPLITNDDLYLATIVADASKNEGVIYAFITDREGRIRAHNDVRWIGKNVNDYKFPGNVYRVVHPILLAGKKEIGKVYIGLDIGRIESTTQKIQLILIIISSIGLFLGIIGSVILSSFMSRPIKQLVHGVQQIAKGKYDVRIKIKSRDEIGELTEAFNNMAKSLKEKEQIKDAFRRYVSHQVAEEIFKDPDKYVNLLKGTRKKVTVLFADVRKFTPLSEKLPPEQVVALLNELLSAMTNVVFRYEGTIDKFIGDCLMAVYGAPIEHSDDPNRAVMSAVDIQKEIQKINERRKRFGQPTMSIGIGINSGEAVVGNIGSQERLDYTVIGDTVNLASRLQEVAGGGEIIISERVFNEINVPFTFQGPYLIKVKGKENPVRIYKLITEQPPPQNST
ncbi:hypothetical protein DRQ23_01050 [bacterium]|nr:MAG: hypothetical protein DRQ23_01050 [bacterium]